MLANGAIRVSLWYVMYYSTVIIIIITIIIIIVFCFFYRHFDFKLFNELHLLLTLRGITLG